MRFVVHWFQQGAAGASNGYQVAGRLPGHSIERALVGGIVKGNDVLGWHLALDVVDVVEDVTAARLERRDVGAHIGGHRGRGAGRQDVLRVTTAAPEDELGTKAAFQFHRVHIFGADLDGVEDVNAVV